MLLNWPKTPPQYSIFKYFHVILAFVQFPYFYSILVINIDIKVLRVHVQHPSCPYFIKLRTKALSQLETKIEIYKLKAKSIKVIPLSSAFLTLRS